MQNAVKFDFFKLCIQTGSAQQQLNVCHHKMDESSSILLGHSCSDTIKCIQHFFTSY